MKNNFSEIACGMRPIDGKIVVLRSVLVGIYVILLIMIYKESYSFMLRWWNSDDYNYCYTIPPMVAYLVWEQRAALRAQPSGTSWWGVVPLALGAMFCLVGELGGEYYTLYFSSWLMVSGLLLLHLGWPRLRTIAFPLLFSIAMFPFPNAINNPLSLKLKLVSSAAGVKILQLLGFAAFREGNVIDLGFTQLQVVDACSGLRYLLPLLIIGLLLAYFSRAPFWKKAILVASAVPLTVAINSLRIASVGLVYQFFGQDMATGMFHDFSGWLIFIFSLGILLGEMWVLKMRAGGVRVPPVSATPSAPQWSAAHSGLRMGLVALLMLTGLLSVLRLVNFREQVPLAKPLAVFPMSVGAWHGSRSAMDQETSDTLRLSDYLLADYGNDHGETVSLYVAYNASQRKGESSHSPATCLPGSGWIFNDSGSAMLPVGPHGEECRVQRSLMQKGSERLLMYYWFPQRGRILTDMVQLKLYVFWDALILHRTDGALVRLLTPVGLAEHPGTAEQRLDGFARQIAPTLASFLPAR